MELKALRRSMHRQRRTYGSEHGDSRRQRWPDDCGDHADGHAKQTETDLQSPVNLILCCAIDEQAELLVAGYADGTVRTWRRHGRRVVPDASRSDTHEGPVHGCAVDGAGTAVLTGGQDGALRRWDTRLRPLGEALVDRALPVATAVWGCAVSRGLERAASALVGGAVQVWDVAADVPTVLPGHAGHVNGVAVSRDGGVVASAGFDGTVRLWDPSAGATASAEPFSAPLQALVLSADGSRVLTVDAYGTTRVGRTSDAAAETVFSTCRTWCMDGTVTADLRTLVVADRAGALEVWDVVDEPRLRHRLPHDNAACVLVGDRLAVSAGHDGTCHGWDVVCGERLWSADIGDGAPVLAVSRGRPTVVAASLAGVVTLLDARTGSGHTLRAAGNAVISCAIGPDGAVAAGTTQGDVLRWHADGTAVPHHYGHDPQILHIASGTPKLPFVSASAAGELAVWGADPDRPPRRWAAHDDHIRHVAVGAADENVVSVGDDKTLRVWTAAGEQEALLPIAGAGQVLALHERGLIACGDDGGFVYVSRLQRPNR